MRSSSRGFLEDTLRQCLARLDEQQSTLEAFVREREAEIEQFRRVAMAEIRATKAVIKAVEEQLGHRPAGKIPPLGRSETQNVSKPISHSKQIVDLTKQILAEEGRPLGRQAIVDRLLARDLDVASNDLPGLVTKALSRSGEFQVEKRLYWFADKPVPAS